MSLKHYHQPSCLIEDSLSKLQNISKLRYLNFTRKAPVTFSYRAASEYFIKLSNTGDISNENRY